MTVVEIMVAIIGTERENLIRIPTEHITRMPHIGVIHSKQVPADCNANMNRSKEHRGECEVYFGRNTSADHRLNDMSM